MKDKLLIIGASGHGKVIADIALKMGLWKTIAFLDDDVNKKNILDFKVIGLASEAVSLADEYDMFVAIGNYSIRETIMKKIIDAGASIPILIHPNATIGIDVSIGIGTVIMGGCVINPSVRIGKGCIINTGVTIDHDNSLEDYVHISPGAHLAGNVKVERATWLGAGCIVCNNVKIESKCIVGAGGVVIKDITEVGTYVGVPVKKIK